MRLEVSYYGYNPCPICWPRKTRIRGELLSLDGKTITLRPDGRPEGSYARFDLHLGYKIKILSSE